MTYDGGTGWDAAPAKRPFEQTGGFLALSAVLVVGAAALGFVLGGAGSGDSLIGSSSGDTGDDAAQQQLVDSLPSSVYQDCKPRQLSEGQVASVSCASAIEGADQIIVSRFSDSDTMLADFDASYRKVYESDQCSTFPGGEDATGTGVVSTYNDNLPLACYVNSNGDATVTWEDVASSTQAVAVRGDADSPALLKWFLGEPKNSLAR